MRDGARSNAACGLPIWGFCSLERIVKRPSGRVRRAFYLARVPQSIAREGYPPGMVDRAARITAVESSDGEIVTVLRPMVIEEEVIARRPYSQIEDAQIRLKPVTNMPDNVIPFLSGAARESDKSAGREGR